MRREKNVTCRDRSQNTVLLVRSRLQASQSTAMQPNGHLIPPAYLQQAIDELLKVYATTAVSIKLRHKAPQLVFGQIDIEPLKNLR